MQMDGRSIGSNSKNVTLQQKKSQILQRPGKSRQEQPQRLLNCHGVAFWHTIIGPLCNPPEFLTHCLLNHHKIQPTVSSTMCDHITCFFLVETVACGEIKNRMFVTPACVGVYNVPKMASLALTL
jgi:hypothetical protein